MKSLDEPLSAPFRLLTFFGLINGKAGSHFITQRKPETDHFINYVRAKETVSLDPHFSFTPIQQQQQNPHPIPSSSSASFVVHLASCLPRPATQKKKGNTTRGLHFSLAHLTFRATVSFLCRVPPILKQRITDHSVAALLNIVARWEFLCCAVSMD